MLCCEGGCKISRGSSEGRTLDQEHALRNVCVENLVFNDGKAFLSSLRVHSPVDFDPVLFPLHISKFVVMVKS